MRSANYAGRVGALAVALGIGVGMAATPWAASAKPPDQGSPSSSDSPSSLSTGPVIDVEQTQRTGIEHEYLDERCDARADRGRHLIRDRPSSVARARGAYIAVYLDQRSLRTRRTPTRLATTTPTTTNTGRRPTVLTSLTGVRPLTLAPSPGCSSSRCRAPKRETRTT
jgi:hypothetical protein